MFESYYYNPLDYNDPPESNRNCANDPEDFDGCRASIIYTLACILLILVSLIMCSSCTTTRYVPVIEHHTDTVIITKHQRDSILVKDSTHVKEKQKGDTVWLEIEKWHTRYIDRSTHDTTYVATHDTVPVPVPVNVEVEKPLSWWQKMRLWLGNITLIIIGIAAGYGAIRLYTKIHSGGIL